MEITNLFNLWSDSFWMNWATSLYTAVACQQNYSQWCWGITFIEAWLLLLLYIITWWKTKIPSLCEIPGQGKRKRELLLETFWSHGKIRCISSIMHSDLVEFNPRTASQPLSIWQRSPLLWPLLDHPPMWRTIVPNLRLHWFCNCLDGNAKVGFEMIKDRI